MRIWKICALFGLLALPATHSFAAPAVAISRLGYRLESVTPVTGVARSYDVVARAGVYNTGDTALNVTAQLTNSGSLVVVADGNVSFGNVARVTRLRPVISSDTFNFRLTIPRTHSFAEALQIARTTIEAFTWHVSCSNCGSNRPPVAHSGANQTAYVDTTVVLDGSASMDPDGDALRFGWTVASAPAGVTPLLSDPASVRPSTTLLVPGTYVFQLIVNDGQVDSAPSLVTVTTSNSAPLAHAGPDQTVPVGARVALNGAASSDVDGDALTYEWRLLEVPGNSGAAIQNADPASPAADFVVDQAGRYVAQLTVRDPQSASNPDTLVVSTVNSAPVARAGADRTAGIGDWIEISGTDSTDADGDALSYRWSLSAPAGSSTVLSAATGTTTGFAPDLPGVYVVQLLVNDGSVDGEADTVVVSTVNSRPNAHAGMDQEVFANDWVYLNGNSSSDADGDPLSFTWSLISVPPDSSALLFDANSPTPFFQADVPGVFVAQLIVSDGDFDSEPSTTQVLVNVRDVDPPVLNIDSPADQSRINTTQVRFRGQANEPLQTLFIGGVYLALDAQNRFDQVILLGEGPHSLYVFAQDMAGNYWNAYWQVEVDTHPPAAPVLMALSREVLSEESLKVRGAAQSVEANAQVRITNLRTGLSITVVANSDGAFEAQIGGLESDDLSIVAADGASNESTATRLNGIGGGELGLQVSAPLDGAVVAGREVIVRGQLTGPADAGLSINGKRTVILESNGVRSFAVQVTLIEGANLIEVVARRPNGASVSRQLHVTTTGGGAFSVAAVPASGIAPFDAMFQISQLGPGEISRTTIDLDGDGDLDIVRDNDDTYIKGRYAVPGVYDARVVITTAEGHVSEIILPITVQDTAQVNAQVQRTWRELRAALVAGDAESALRLFEPESAEAYRPLLTAPGVDLAVLANDLGPITPYKLGSSFAEYLIVRSAGGVDSAFVVSFMRTADGVWRLSAL